MRQNDCNKATKQIIAVKTGMEAKNLLKKGYF